MRGNLITKLSPELEEIRLKVEETAREVGLDFYPTQFHMLDFKKLNQVIANIGFPQRYVHWRFGMEYKKLMKQLGYGFGRIYELVINTDPSIAYLLSYNKKVQQTMVMAHVYGHVDFFKNNMAFANTDRNMLNTMADHSRIIEHHYQKQGFEKVEKFIDTCLSIEGLVDPFFDIIKKPKKSKGNKCKNKKEGEINLSGKVRPYLEKFVEKALKKRGRKTEIIKAPYSSPGENDVLKFIMDNASHLKNWQRDILSIIREERYYFIPQIRTKIMNEGWATFWHSYLMTKKGLAGDAGIFKYAETHAGVIGNPVPEKGQVNLGINPYTLGFLLFKDIEDRWNKGRYGPEYEDEKNVRRKREWDTGEMNGLKKIFEVRKYKTDVGFIREFFTDEFIRKYHFFLYGASGHYDVIKSTKAEKIRDNLVSSLVHYGEPVIEALDSNYKNKGLLLLNHVDEGLELHKGYTIATLKNIFKIWRRSVHLKTKVEGKDRVVMYNGDKIQIYKWHDRNKTK